MSSDRAHPRVPVSVQANISVHTPQGATVRAERVANISLGGIFIEMENPPAFGSELQIEMKLEGNHAGVRCTGFVAWSTRNHPEANGRAGVGLRLTGLSIADMKYLADYIEARMPDAVKAPKVAKAGR